MNKKILLQATAGLGAAAWLLLSGCAGMGGSSGSGCGGTSASSTCTGSKPQCAANFQATCQTGSDGVSMNWVCVQQ